VRALTLSGTGAPSSQPATCRAPPAVSRNTRTGDPPTSTAPPDRRAPPGSSRVAASARNLNPTGTRSSTIRAIRPVSAVGYAAKRGITDGTHA
jgi:hypothetical protein